MLAVVVVLVSCESDAVARHRGDEANAVVTTAVDGSEDAIGSTVPATSTTAGVTGSTEAPTPSDATGRTATSDSAVGQPASVGVVDIVDGDTIKVAGGQSVRLIGIDTPERGQCGYTEAAFVLASLIRGRPVVLVPGARTDTDHYGRLLRYVEVEGVDVNLEMIRSGRAIARYDSRDGYGRHPRQDLYVTTDAETPSTNNCTPAPGGANTTAPPGGVNTILPPNATDRKSVV